MSGSAGSPSPAVLRAVAILQAISEADAFPGVSDLARALEIPKSSAANVLAALTETGLVRRVGTGYSLGSRLVDLASAFLRDDDPVTKFRTFVTGLPTASHETIQLATLDGSDVLYLARHDGTQPISLTSAIGRRLPASSTALGKALLAGLSDGEVRNRLVEPLPQLTANSHTTIDALLGDLANVRARGFAIDDEEAAPNAVCIAVAVPGPPGDGAYAVSATLFKTRMDDDLERRLAEDLIHLARSISTT